MRINRSSSVALILLVSLSYFVLSLGESVSASSTVPMANTESKSPNLILTSANPQLDCRGSGELKGGHPGWSAPESIKLTAIDLGNQTYGVFWCPASAPAGQGVISYTLTEPSRAGTCETTETYCAISGITDKTPLWIMATDATGSYKDLGNAIQNSGDIDQCEPTSLTCSVRHELLSTGFAGISGNGAADCTFAAVANWEKISLGLPINQKLLTAEFAATGGSGKGLTDDQVFSYWKRIGINGVHLNSASRLPIDPVTLKQVVGGTSKTAVIAQLNFSTGSTFAGVQISSPSFHWLVVDGYTGTGPVVVTWGKSYQMTWQQWNLEAMNMWRISAN